MKERIIRIAAWLLAPCEFMNSLAGLPYSRLAYIASLLGSLAAASLLCMENSALEFETSTKVSLLVAGVVCQIPITYEAYKTPPEA